jgi:hypothetical protein
MPVTSFLISFPTFAVLLPKSVLKAGGCSGAFPDSAPHCINPQFSLLYNLVSDLTLIALLLSVIVVPLVLILSALSLMRMGTEAVHDGFWWIRITMTVIAICAQLSVVGVFLSQTM